MGSVTDTEARVRMVEKTLYLDGYEFGALDPDEER